MDANPMARLFTITIIFILSFCSAYGRRSVLKSSGKPRKLLLEPVEVHLQFYWHESFSGPDASSIIIAGANSTDSADKGFGTTYAFDNPLTFDPVPPASTSDVVGHMQGFYVFSAKGGEVLTVTLNLVLEEPVFKGSVLSFQGRVDLDSQLREVPIVGGSGLFRGATGYYVSQKVSSLSHSNISLFDIYVTIYSDQKITADQ